MEELIPFVTRWHSLHMKCRLYMSCVRSAVLYCSGTWPVKDDDVKRMKHTEKNMMILMRNRLWSESISEALRLHWFGHVERKKNVWVKTVTYSELEGKVPESRPRKIWDEVLRKDLENKGIVRHVALDCVA